ncbi:hypothetical protein BPOR_0030g00130 [Botrytis porri]|uniref:Uncharacterized protein n=1 Tax=Botrytis porri TaxID=87229 RepID=A0A4Z1L457_9HELO|nr:hypothetical protein BPOR_0030g00130 [Botrytis porri]
MANKQSSDTIPGFAFSSAFESPLSKHISFQNVLIDHSIFVLLGYRKGGATEEIGVEIYV